MPVKRRTKRRGVVRKTGRRVVRGGGGGRRRLKRMPRGYDQHGGFFPLLALIPAAIAAAKGGHLGSRGRCGWIRHQKGVGQGLKPSRNVVCSHSLANNRPCLDEQYSPPRQKHPNRIRSFNNPCPSSRRENSLTGGWRNVSPNRRRDKKRRQRRDERRLRGVSRREPSTRAISSRVEEGYP